MQRIAIYGGSFNPPHLGHLIAAQYVSLMPEIDEVWLTPAYNHPFGKDLVPFSLRVEMLKAMTAHLPKIDVSLAEAIVPEGTGFTLDLIHFLKELRPDDSFRIVLGTDILFTTHKWNNFSELCELAPPIILNRTGFMVPWELFPRNSTQLPLPLPQLSSTSIRTMLENGESVDGYLHPDVTKIIRDHALYRSAKVA